MFKHKIQRLQQLYSRARTLPWHFLLLKIVELLAQRIVRWGQHKIDLVASSFGPTQDRADSAADWRSLLPHLPKATIAQALPSLPQLTELYLSHQFDLLGSGWTHVHHGLRAQGLEGHRYESHSATEIDTQGLWLHKKLNWANRQAAQKIWRKIQTPYTPIDWHLDFKSGYRWSEKTWWSHVPYGHLPGIDIKVPWELSRAQHLPQLALAYQAHGGSGEIASRITREIRNQILDFIATNPPRFGVNWRCPMDVAIRAANWLCAVDLLQAAGHKWDADFKGELMRSLQAHGRFIYANLEKSGEFRGNHYLADIAGLTWIACYLPETPRTQKWLRFCYQALLDEARYQFHSSGSNFEGSTSYHRLSSEMLLYSAALLLALPRRRTADLHASSAPLFPIWFQERVYRSAEFSQAVTGQDQNIVQIGDCDSGRFFKLHPLFDERLQENHLNQSGLWGAVEGLFKISNPRPSLEREILSRMNPDKWAVPPSYAPSIPTTLTTPLQASTHRLEYKIPFAQKIDPQQVQLQTYFEFGLFIFRTADLLLCVRCGPVGQLNRGGHDHNDQLSIELHFKNQKLIVDPGTYTYTPLPEWRNQYRSVRAHFAPYVEGREPCALNQGLFSLSGSQQGQVLHLSSTRIGMCHHAYGSPLYRQIEIQEDGLLIQDWVESTTLRLAKPQPLHLPYSHGYGLRN